jgi:hypothetical protein
MKTLYFLFASVMKKPVKINGSNDRRYTPAKGRRQSNGVMLMLFTTPNNQLQIFAPRSRRFD